MIQPSVNKLSQILCLLVSVVGPFSRRYTPIASYARHVEERLDMSSRNSAEEVVVMRTIKIKVNVV